MGVFLIACQHLHLFVASDKYHGCSAFSYVIGRSIFIDNRSVGRQPAFFADGVVGSGLSADGESEMCIRDRVGTEDFVFFGREGLAQATEIFQQTVLVDNGSRYEDVYKRQAMRSAEADGINVDEHFNLMVEMVGVGSGARRSVENYHLTDRKRVV